MGRWVAGEDGGSLVILEAVSGIGEVSVGIWDVVVMLGVVGQGRVVTLGRQACLGYRYNAVGRDLVFVIWGISIGWRWVSDGVVSCMRAVNGGVSLDGGILVEDLGAPIAGDGVV